MDLQDIRSMAWKCPRCDSLDTKFCYYNNYNYSQPRHFCKTCRRYWTIGGVLRKVPVGGGSRKSKNISKPAMIVKDSPSSNSNSNSGILSSSRLRPAVDSCTVNNLGSVGESRSDLEILPTQLKLNQAGDWYSWIENGRELEAGIVVAAEDPPAEKRARGEGFGSLDHLPTSGETE